MTISKKTRKILDDWRIGGFAVDISQDAVLITATPATLSLTGYADGDCIGTKLTFTNAARAAGGSGIVNSAMLYDLNNQGVGIELALFDTDPSGTTFTDNAALDIVDADMPKLMGFIAVDTFSAFSDTQLGIPTPGDTISLPFKCASTTRDIYGVMVGTAAATYTATADLGVRLGIVQL